MKSVDRLLRIACYYNRVKFADFYNVYTNVRIKDTRSIVYHVLVNELNYSTYQVSELFNKPMDFIDDMCKYHAIEYDQIYHYRRQYLNTLTQFNNWNNTDLDLAYSIIKTKYDYDTDIKYEQILNDNCRLENENQKLKIKLNKISYV